MEGIFQHPVSINVPVPSSGLIEIAPGGASHSRLLRTMPICAVTRRRAREMHPKFLLFCTFPRMAAREKMGVKGGINFPRLLYCARTIREVGRAGGGRSHKGRGKLLRLPPHPTSSQTSSSTLSEIVKRERQSLDRVQNDVNLIREAK